MDLSTIPVLGSNIIMGLDYSMRPENVRFEASKGFTKPLPEIVVMHKIKSLALMVYNQEKLTPLYHANVCEESHPLAYFLCAMHRQSSPQSQKKRNKKKTHHTSTESTISMESKASTCASGESTSSCELPRLVTTSMLPLGYWDSLYYALIAEIRFIYADLQDKFGWSIEHGDGALHYEGLNGKHGARVTAKDLASILEAAWYALMDNRLVAALDDAVRLRKLQESAAKCSVREDGGKSTTQLPFVGGLVDVNGMAPEDIIALLWDKHANEVDQACAESFEDESMLPEYRAHLHAQTVKETRALDVGSPPTPKCRCIGRCICYLRCDIHADHCTCAPNVRVYRKLHPLATAEDIVPSQQDTLDLAPGSVEVELPSDAEMQLRPNSASALKSGLVPPPLNTGKPKVEEGLSAEEGRKPAEEKREPVEEENRPKERQVPSRYKNRQRTNTDDSALVYVPEGHTRSKGKDAFPLGFYGSGSPGRYPKMRKDSASTQNQADFIKRTLPRKPVPPPLHTSQQYVAPQAGYGMVTPPSERNVLAARAKAAYAENARLSRVLLEQHDGLTQSFPVTGDNPRKAVASDPFVDTSSPTDPANDYVSLLTRHPSSYDQQTAGAPAEPFPKLSRAPSTTPPRLPKTPSKSKASASTTRLPTLKSLTGDTSKPVPPLPPLPPLPDPDFIAPRPATVQRYVSAGGTLPLAQRPEIAGPAFCTTPAGFSNVASGAGISKAEIDARMSDPEWVRAHFGEGAVPPPARGSGDSGVSGRVSRETGTGGRVSVEQQQQAPRTRTSSGVSSTRQKLMRVFSRKGSGIEED